MSKELTPAERHALRGRAHRLDPVVMIGAEGLTSAVLAEVDRALKAHELIKVRIGGADRDERETLGDALAEATDAAVVHRIGKILMLWRPGPEGDR